MKLSDLKEEAERHNRERRDAFTSRVDGGYPTRRNDETNNVEVLFGDLNKVRFSAS